MLSPTAGCSASAGTALHPFVADYTRLSQTARALLNFVGAMSADAAGQTSAEVAPLVREAEKALRQASKHFKQL